MPEKLATKALSAAVLQPELFRGGKSSSYRETENRAILQIMDKKVIPPKKLRLAVLITNLVITVAIGLLVALLPNGTPLGVHLAILAANIVALFSVLQFFIEQKFLEYENNIKSLDNKICDIEKCVGISEVYKKILLLDEEEKEFHWNNLNDVEKKLNRLVKERRSGGLARSVYYRKLHDAANKIKADIKGKDRRRYKGEIWAMSFWQNDEWDANSNDYEDGWIRALEEMDSLGIRTTRIAVMSYKNILLKREFIDCEVDNLLKKIVDNCHENRVRKNTTTLFINDIDDDEKKIVGKGFFAIKLEGKNGELSLIRGVSLDKLEGSELEGELVFDPNEIRKIRKVWEQFRNTGKAPKEYFLKQYSNGNISEEIKEEMVKRGLNWFDGKSSL